MFKGETEAVVRKRQLVLDRAYEESSVEKSEIENK